MPFHPGRCAQFTLADGSLIGHAGELHPKVTAALGLPARTVAAEVDVDAHRASESRATARDARHLTGCLAPTSRWSSPSPRRPPASKLLCARGGELLESVSLFDIYRVVPRPGTARSRSLTAWPSAHPTAP